MFHLVESICIERKVLHHIDLHNKRFNKARKKLFNADDWINLDDFIIITENLNDSRYKCRVSTSNGKNLKVEIVPYIQRKIETIKLIEVNDIDYSIKTDQRELLNSAYDKRGNCDDIIIVKNNCITDSWAANVILFDGKHWVTPNTPLLEGVQREYLLSTQRIITKRIYRKDLHFYQKIKLINALVDFERAPTIEIGKIEG